MPAGLTRARHLIPCRLRSPATLRTAASYTEHRPQSGDPIMPTPEPSRRKFVKLSTAALAVAATQSARSYAKIVGANDRVRVGVVGCGDRMKQGDHSRLSAVSAKEMNFQIVAVSDIWSRRREEGAAFIQKLCGNPIDAVRNNDELLCPQRRRCRPHRHRRLPARAARHRSRQCRPRRLRRKAHRGHHGRRPQLPRRRQKVRQNRRRSEPSAAPRPPT